MSDAQRPGSASKSILLRELSVSVGEKPLLRQVNAEIPGGEITLIVGASGAGKSVFLNLLAGLIRPGEGAFEVSGEVEVCGKSLFSPSKEIGVGIVFQNFALFDELSALGNVRFGYDHCRRNGAQRRGEVAPNVDPAQALLEEFGVPGDVPVAVLSGGQKQRLAIARTLAYDPDVIVYDEPTSGLDPANANKVAARIRQTQEKHGKTTVVVTHDYEHLAGIATNVFLLDHEQHTLVPFDGARLETIADRILATSEKDVRSAVVAGKTSKTPHALARWGLARIGDFFDATTRVVEAMLVALLGAIPTWTSVRWGLRYFWHYLSLLASPSSFAYFGAAGLIAGFVSTHFTFKFLPFKAYTEPLITEELLQGLGFSLYRIIVPVLLTVLVAARSGAAVAADVGSRRYSRQIDALRSFGANPNTYLLTNILYGFALATPVLVFFGFLVARITSLAIFSYNYPQHSALFWEGHFHRALEHPAAFFYTGTGWVVLKVLSCGLGVGAIAYFQGLKPKPSGVEVSRSITRTIIWATLYVLLVHFMFAFIEFDAPP